MQEHLGPFVVQHHVGNVLGQVVGLALVGQTVVAARTSIDLVLPMWGHHADTGLSRKR